jgi:DNA-binding response OmpR family regulator
VTERAAQVLLVEDDESLRRILARQLRARGHDVDEAGSAEEAGSILGEGVRPGVVLLDINLPGDNGWDLLRGPSLAAAGSPPVIITSAVTINPKRLTEFGCAGYLPKPFPLETLVATVDRLLGPRGHAST